MGLGSTTVQGDASVSFVKSEGKRMSSLFFYRVRVLKRRRRYRHLQLESIKPEIGRMKKLLFANFLTSHLLDVLCRIRSDKEDRSCDQFISNMNSDFDSMSSFDAILNRSSSVFTAENNLSSSTTLSEDGG
ncbi:hypothetical protein M5K25_000474 [Dendrobium thyrsiflorum]|uniref:Uncharacterized protein n=1 Tax=Dendrobium thyrsiflorum TaxID=117978 RepID=A0ABD0VTQ3_DENTH